MPCTFSRLPCSPLLPAAAVTNTNTTTTTSIFLPSIIHHRSSPSIVGAPSPFFPVRRYQGFEVMGSPIPQVEQVREVNEMRDLGFRASILRAWFGRPCHVACRLRPPPPSAIARGFGPGSVFWVLGFGVCKRWEIEKGSTGWERGRSRNEKGGWAKWYRKWGGRLSGRVKSLRCWFYLYIKTTILNQNIPN